MDSQIKNILKIALSILLLLCLLKMPYGYFQLVRFIGTIVFIILAYFEKDKTNKILMVVWICSALLINPFIKTALGRFIWNIVDVAWAILLIGTFLFEKNEK